MNLKTIKTLFFALGIVAINSCSGENAKVKRSFYWWQAGNLNNYESHFFEEAQAEKLYVKVFEIMNDELEGNIPVTKSYMKMPSSFLKNTEIVPCIFVENDVISKTTDDQLATLAENTVFLVNKFLNEKLKKNLSDKVNCDELQIDCDWLESSKDQYFKFLKEIKKHWDKSLSCTLRLYPYKFNEKMGVPPVDRAMLLCYNLLDPRSNNDKNSILDLQELEKYVITDKKYPLPLDVGLPAYSSCYVFSNGQFDEVKHGLSSDLESICLPSEDNLWYTVKSDTSLNYSYYKKGNRLKIERVSEEVLLKATEIIVENVEFGNDMTVALYHLDEQELINYNHETLDSVYLLFDKR